MSLPRLLDLIPIEVLRRGLREPDCELDGDFLGFEDLYAAASVVLDKSLTVIDLGCYVAAQAWFFKDFKAYIGVDHYELFESPYIENPGRFIGPPNASMVQMDAVDWLETCDLDFKQTIVIVSAVPDGRVYRAVKSLCDNFAAWYPGEGFMAAGAGKRLAPILVEESRMVNELRYLNHGEDQGITIMPHLIRY